MPFSNLTTKVTSNNIGQNIKIGWVNEMPSFIVNDIWKGNIAFREELNNSVDILPTGNYSVGVEYTPKTDPLQFIYFTPGINWASMHITNRQWYDNEHEQIRSFGLFPSRENTSLVTAIFLINRQTKTVILREIYNTIITANGIILEKPQSFDGIFLRGIFPTN